MRLNDPVKIIMTNNVRTVNVNDTLHDALSVTNKYNIRHLPVIEGNRIKGVISATDIDRLTFDGIFNDPEGGDEAVLEMLTIPQVMSSNLRTIDAHASIAEAAQIFVTEKFHALPVVDGDKLVGIVTTTDVIAHMMDE